MMKLDHENESIEGKRFDISVRKLIPRVAVKFQKGGRVYYFHSFKSQISGTAIILQEYTPKDFIISEKSHLDEGDEIGAPVIELYLSKNSGLSLISNFSSTHGIQNFKSDDFSYGIIRTPFRYVLEKYKEAKSIRA
jgi:hypothetical protein